jgi:glycosyltransferase involved in cell wall biosynthesis
MLKKKTICFVLPVHTSHTIGGAQYQAECFLNQIVGLEKYHVYYVANLSDPTCHPTNYKLIHLDTNYQKKNLLSLIRSSNSLINTLHRIKPDIIYQRIGCYQTAICTYYAKKTECSIFFHISSDKDVNPIHSSMGRNIFFNYFEKKMVEFGVKNSKKIIAQTHYQAGQLKQNFNRTADAVVYNFHPIPDKHVPKDKPIRIVWIANVKKIKQPEVFIRLAQDLHFETGATFTMVGKMQGTKQWRKRIQQLMRQTDGIEYLGFIPQESVNQLLSRSHILINTSNFEGFSNTFIQAWMRKVPVISLHVDPDNLLQRKQIGRLSGNYDRLKQDVKEMIENDNLRETIGENAFNYSFKNHSFENINQIVKLIDM